MSKTVEVRGARLRRGYEAVFKPSGKLEFLGAPDGPLLEIRGPRGQWLLMDVGMVDELVAAMQMVAAPLVAEVGAHDAEAEAMNYRLLDSRA